MIHRLMLAVAIASAGALQAVAPSGARADEATFSVGPQYDSTHVYVPTADFDRFVASFVATFGGTTTPKGTAGVTPTASQTMSQLVLTPSGTASVFGFVTPIPYPFGAERTGYLVTNVDAAVDAARADGAALLVAPFNDPIGRDAVLQWPGGIPMQFYRHTTAPHYPALRFNPENRAYVSPDAADAFVRAFVAFAHGGITSDDRKAPGVEIGRPGDSYRRIDIASGFGKLRVIVTDGHLPFPYGREPTGYEVADLNAALGRATSTGATILVQPYPSEARRSAMVEFPGGYIAEIHQTV